MQIETERLILRKHSTEDYERFWNMITDPISKRFTGGVTTLTYAQRLKIFCEDININFPGNNVEFAVVEKSSMLYIGYCGFRECEYLDGIELFYGYCRDSWGNGFGYEAAASTVAYYFNNTEHNSLVAACNMENLASVNILKRLGFKFVKQVIINGMTVDKYELYKS